MFTFTSAQLDLWVGQWIWPFCRVMALFSVAPVLNHRSLPAPIKIMLSLAIAALLAPNLAGPVVSLSSPSALAVLAQQMLLGLTIGFSMRLVFAAVELAGDLIGLQMGLSFASFIDPHSSAQTPLIGSLLGIMASLLFLSMNGHLMMISALTDSFSTFPIGALGGDNHMPVNSARLVSWTGELFRIGLHLSLPVLVTMLILNLGLGVLVRSAPQLNLFAVGFPITLITGLLVMLLSLPYVAPYLQTALERATQF
jgi:flagellar biosynthetic protein FliR